MSVGKIDFNSNYVYKTELYSVQTKSINLEDRSLEDLIDLYEQEISNCRESDSYSRVNLNRIENNIIREARDEASFSLLLRLWRIEPLGQGVDDSVQRISHGDNGGVWAMLLNAISNLAGDLEINGQQLFAARERAVRAGFARHPGRVDDQIRAGNRRVILRSNKAYVATDGW